MAKKKKTKVIEEKKFSITILYDERCHVIEEGEPESEGKYRWQGVDGKDFDISSVHVYPQKRGWPSQIDVDFDPEEHVGENIYIVVVRYSTGDTFGQTEGEWHLEGAYLDAKEAKEIADSIEDDTYKGDSYHWKGYFERLEGASVVLQGLQY